MRSYIEIKKLGKEGLQKIHENLDKIDAKKYETKEELENAILNLLAISFPIDKVEEWVKKSPVYYPDIVKNCIEKVRQEALTKKTVLYTAQKCLNWFIKETHLKAYEEQIRTEKNIPYLIDCLDYDRYEEIFYNAGSLYTLRKEGTSIAKDTEKALWQEVRLHIKHKIANKLKYNKLSEKDKESILKFSMNLMKNKIATDDYENILSDEQKKAKIEQYTQEKFAENKVHLQLSDFYIETKELVCKIQPENFNNDKVEYNYFRPGVITKLKCNAPVTECPDEFNKLLDNLAGEKEKHWLINHFAAYLQNFLSGFKLHRKIETIPLFYGTHGSGKNTLMDYFCKLISEDVICEVDKQMFESGFNEWKKRSVVILNEFGKSKEDKRDFSDKIKLLTSPNFTINEKFKPTINIENRLYIAIAANESPWGALSIEKCDRRIQYISGGRNVGKNEAYATEKVFSIEKLEEQFNDFGNFLMNYKVDWDFADTVFTNEAKEADIENSLDQYEVIIKAWLEDNPTRESVTATEIFHWAELNGHRNFNVQGFGKRLKLMFGKSVSLKNCEVKEGSIMLYKHLNGYKINVRVNSASNSTSTSTSTNKTDFIDNLLKGL